MSLVRIPIKIEIEGLGQLDGELIRFHAPLTVSALIRMLPISGAIAKWDYAIYFQAPLERGAEKPVSRVSAGDILYWPPGSCVALAFAEATPPAQMTRIGRYQADYERLRDIQVGARIMIRKA
ncbi:MAG: cyclophilin-like fold protein [Nitrososphaerota archaeon]